LKGGDLDKAERHYREALALDGSCLDALYSIGYVASRRGDHAAAEDGARKALAVDPMCLAFVAVLVLVRSRVGGSENLRQAAWRTAGPFWCTGGALGKAQCAAGRSLGRLRTRFLAHVAHSSE
jgi:tetratricopeptide (TPR) repeat protein